MSDVVDADAIHCRAMVLFAAEYFSHKEHGTWRGIPPVKDAVPFDPDAFMRDEMIVFAERLKERGMFDLIPDYARAML